MDDQPATRLNTVADLCGRWRVSRPTVEAMIRDGRLDVVRFGRAVRIPEDSAAQLMAASRLNASEGADSIDS